MRPFDWSRGKTSGWGSDEDAHKAVMTCMHSAGRWYRFSGVRLLAIWLFTESIGFWLLRIERMKLACKVDQSDCDFTMPYCTTAVPFSYSVTALPYVIVDPRNSAPRTAASCLTLWTVTR